MSPGPGAAFPICQASLRGCTGKSDTILFCQHEARSVYVCRNCAGIWRANATATSLYERCPRCAIWRQETRLPGHPAAPPVLNGDVGAALDAAMGLEGLTAWVRLAVLARLGRDAPWLATISIPAHA